MTATLKNAKTGDKIDCYVFDRRLVDFIETDQIEFKNHDVVMEENMKEEQLGLLRPYSETLNAFLNSDGGVLIAGIRDNRNVKGIPLSNNQKLHMRMEICHMFNNFSPAVSKDLYDVKFVPVVFWDQTYYFPDTKVPSEQDLNRDHLLIPESFKCWCYTECINGNCPLYVVEIRVKNQKDQEKILYKNEQGEVFQRGLASNLNLAQVERDIHHLRVEGI